MTEEGYPIYLQAKPFRVSSPCVPAERRLPQEKKCTQTATAETRDLADPNPTLF